MVGKNKKEKEVEKPNLYALLKVEHDATVSEIRKAYFRLALKVHPDKNPDDCESGKNFVALQQAYDILKDPVKRKYYDRTGNLNDDLSTSFWQAYEKYKSVEITEADIEDYCSKFHGSEQEEQDIFDHYTTKKGDITAILGSIIGSTDADVPRFINILDRALKERKLDESFETTYQESKDQVLSIAELDELVESEGDDDSNEDDDEDDDSFIDNDDVSGENEEPKSSDEDSEVSNEENKQCKYEMNNHVKARWRKGPTYYNGVIVGVHYATRTYDVKYDDDNLVEKDIKENLVKPRKQNEHEKEVKVAIAEPEHSNVYTGGKKKRKKVDDEEYGDMDALRKAMLGKDAQRSSGFEAFADKWMKK